MNGGQHVKRNICQVCTSDALTTCLQNRENLNIFAANTHQKFASATPRKASNNSTSSAWPYLASPVVEGSSLLDFSCCLGFFSSGSCQECQAQAAFVWSKQCPFTSTFKNPKTKALLQPNPTRFASLEEGQKSTPVPFAGALCAVEEMVPSCLGPSRVAEPLRLGGLCWWLSLCLQYPATQGNCISVLPSAHCPQTKSLLT